MKTKLLYFICLLSFIACNQTWKEYSDADIEYDENTNTWFLKSDSSVIKENFITNDGLIDDMPFRREITVDENGHVQTAKHYIGDELIMDGDFKKAPLEFERAVFPSHPTLGDPDLGLYYTNTKRTATGSTILLKNKNRVVIVEYIYDKEGKLVKQYDWEDGKRKITISDLFSVEDLKVGLVATTSASTYFRPGVIFKIRNKTGQTITKYLDISYKLIKDDEILASDSKLISSEAGWDDNMTKSVVITISKVVYKRNELPKLDNKPTGEKIVITYEDGSILYEGPIISKIIGVEG